MSVFPLTNESEITSNISFLLVTNDKIAVEQLIFVHFVSHL